MNTTRSSTGPQRRGRQSLLAVFSILTVLGFGLVVSVVACASPAGSEPGTAASLRQASRAFADVAREVSPAVAFVKVEKTIETSSPLSFAVPQGNNGDPGNNMLRRFFELPFGLSSPPHQEHVEGQGSGFLVSDDGYILTNNHVVGDSDEITVTLDDGREFPAKLVGADARADVAVVKIDADHLPALEFADSDAVEVGEWVVAVGNPFGLSRTITAGIVSAKGRSRVGIADYEDFIQTDAAINPGNSGGPLVDLDGRVVGMNTAIFSKSGGYMGIGFAIPANMIKSISEQLIDHGEVTRGFLGVVVQELTPNLAQTFELGDRHGALVAEVNADSPAAAAGLQAGDLIVALNGEPVKDSGELRNRIAMIAPDTRVEITVVRGGQEKRLDVTVGRLADQAVAGTGRGADHAGFGFTVQELTPELAAQLGVVGESGVVVTQVVPGSPAAVAGIQRGTLIQEVNRRPVASVEQFREALGAGGQTDKILLLVRSGNFAHYVVLEKR